MSAISDIDICYSDIGRKYVGLKTVILIKTSDAIAISDVQEIFFSSTEYEPKTLDFIGERFTS